MFSRSILPIALAGTALFLASCGEKSQLGGEDEAAVSAAAGEVNVYSGRHYDNDLVLFDEFTEQTGVEVNLIEGRGDALIERIAQEGAESPADLFVTADAGILWRADQRGIFQPLNDAEIAARVPSQFRHPDGHWIGVSSRARIVIYNEELGLPDGLSTYLDLAKPEFKGMICVRPSSNIYNQSLLASIIANHGEAAAEEWAAGVVSNFARKPQGNDTAQIEAVAAGICQLGIVNSYYVARFFDSDDPEKDAIGAKIGVLFPSQETTGAHVNISGAGVVANAANVENAKKLVAFLLQDDVQARFAQGNNEYPVVEGVSPQGPVTALGSFRADDVSVTAFGENQAKAIEIFDRAGWQ